MDNASKDNQAYESWQGNNAQPMNLRHHVVKGNQGDLAQFSENEICWNRWF